MPRIPNQIGRSMTEMLGVLAVMAVLTIGGIAGYNYAMNKHRANVILNDVKQMAVMGIAQDFLGHNDVGVSITPADLGAELIATISYEISKETEDSFFITGGKISFKVCQILIKETPAFVEQIIPNPLGLEECTKGDNEIDFYVNADMNGTLTPDRIERCDDAHPCNECGECIGGLCVDNDDKCPSGEYCVGGTCGCPRGQVKDNTGKCRKCDDATVFTASQTECNKCSERVSYVPKGGAFLNKTACSTCPAGSTVDLTRSRCLCPMGQMWNLGGNGDRSVCASCSDQAFVVALDEECHRCPNQFVRRQGGACYGCLVGAAIGATLEQCNRCPKRYLDTATTECKLCPAGQSKNAAGTGCL